ncbi:hypothetical protein DPEC_G00164010 [Dallia pectoralis]|uniref:Uncharacterized protein n=1 Tax=Dallia pectoralis TaxID=75939 RepID=A0ACC2GGR0_DALPE|nr:hypothetical protein DPEC_G00164010 [Dallia pectoralis]
MFHDSTIGAVRSAEMALPLTVDLDLSKRTAPTHPRMTARGQCHGPPLFCPSSPLSWERIQDSVEFTWLDRENLIAGLIEEATETKRRIRFQRLVGEGFSAAMLH